jgi:hypothetical protein
MTSPVSSSNAALRLGYWSASLTALFCVVFTIAALLTESQRLSPPWDVVLIALVFKRSDTLLTS